MPRFPIAVGTGCCLLGHAGSRSNVHVGSLRCKCPVMISGSGRAVKGVSTNFLPWSAMPSQSAHTASEGIGNGIGRIWPETVSQGIRRAERGRQGRSLSYVRAFGRAFGLSAYCRPIGERNGMPRPHLSKQRTQATTMPTHNTTQKNPHSTITQESTRTTQTA
ncbi:hypothetical protein [Pseudomonas phage Eisa9]|uniref:Uncharacterized protein n=1 Tax=Pseudomonas phage Eisa9 TaxID=2900148 RepID=A0AAE8YKI3_9CAUD|nr:hypothetical protein [Pseudomonas phage Eisa9]